MKDAYQRDQEEWLEAYREVSRLTGFKIKDLVGRSCCVITDRRSKLFGRVGVIHHGDSHKEYYQFRKGGKIYDFNSGEVDSGANVKMVLNRRLELLE